MLEWLERHYERVPARFASAVGEMGKPAAPEIVQVAVERFEMPQAHAGEGSLEIQIAGYQRAWTGQGCRHPRAHGGCFRQYPGRAGGR